MLAQPAALAPLTALLRPGRRRHAPRHAAALVGHRWQAGGKRAQMTIIIAPPTAITACAEPASVLALRLANCRLRHTRTSLAVTACVCAYADMACWWQSCRSVCRRTGLRVGTKADLPRVVIQCEARVFLGGIF